MKITPHSTEKLWRVMTGSLLASGPRKRARKEGLFNAKNTELLRVNKKKLTSVRKVDAQGLTYHIARTRPSLVLFGKKTESPSIYSDVLGCCQKIENCEANGQENNIRTFRIQGSLDYPRKTN